MKKMIMILTIVNLLLFLLLVGCIGDGTTEPNQAPTVTITNCPSNNLTSSSYTFEWSGTDSDGDITKYYYELDDSTPDSYTFSTSKDYTNLSEGDHVFYVKAKDNDGDYSEVESCSFTVDIADEITVTSPNGEETWQMGSTHNITWTDNISENVKIELYRSGSLAQTIVSSTFSDGTYTWTIPTNLTESFYYKIKITSTTNSSINAWSEDYFTITDTGGNLNVSPVNLTITNPTSSGTFEVWNSGGGTLSYTITENCNWLSVSPTGGSSTGEHDDITATVNWSYFDEGDTETCTVSVSGGGETETISVTAIMPDPEDPIPCTSTTSLTIYEPTTTATFQVWNCGAGTLEYTITESCSWLSVSPPSGTSTGEPDDITATVNWSYINSQQTVSIYVESDYGNIAVTITVIPEDPEAELCTDPSSIEIDQTSTTGTFEVWNCGDVGSTLNYSITEGCSWLSVSPTGGSSTGEPDDITATVNWSGFTPNQSQSCNVTVTGGGDTDNISVTANAMAETITTPTQPSGSSSGDVGESLSYLTGGASSNWGHSVEYRFDWDDGNYSSWGSSSRSHSWDDEGTYYVKAQARCTQHTSCTSNWSSARTVSITEIEIAYIECYFSNGGFYCFTNIDDIDDLYIKYGEMAAHPIEDPDWNSCPNDVQVMKPTGTDDSQQFYFSQYPPGNNMGIDVASSCTSVTVEIMANLEEYNYGIGGFSTQTDYSNCPEYEFYFYNDECISTSQTIPSSYLFYGSPTEIAIIYDDTAPTFFDYDGGVKEVTLTFNGWEVQGRLEEIVPRRGIIIED